MFDYEPFLERDEDGIRAAISGYRGAHSSDELFLQVARFAVLAFAPSLHAGYAMVAVLAAHGLRERFPAEWDAILTECAVYAAGSRQPWSEPPLFDPPAVDPSEAVDLGALRAAVAAGDRLRAERWLAANLGDERLERDLLTAAADDFEDSGHAFVITSAALQLAKLLGDKGRFLVLRTAIVQMCASRSEPYEETGQVAADLAERLVSRAVEEKGSLEAMHSLFLYDAAMQCGMARRAGDYLTAELRRARPPRPSAHDESGGVAIVPPVYRFARDYGAYLRSFGVAERLRDERVIAAARMNLENGPTFEDWSFA